MKSAGEDSAGAKPGMKVQPASKRSGLVWPGIGAGLVALGLGVVGWVFWPGKAPSVSVPVVATAPAGVIAIQTASEDQILRQSAAGFAIYRLTTNPRILVLDFQSLREQGLMLNRIGAFAEKAKLPRDHVLTDAELAKVITDGGDTTETFYYGHDYSARTLARFFALADRDHIPLNPQEEWLRRLLRQEGWFAPDVLGGLISIPHAGADAHVSAEARRTILHHELSHGEYFSNPVYTAYVHQFWRSVLTPREADNIRKHLGSESYDTALDDLMENEMQAYLMFTDNPDFFTPAMIHMSPARLGELRAQFMRAIPVAWLRPTDAPQAAAVSAKVPAR